jgi:2-dehydro-3-deoxygluconokinase
MQGGVATDFIQWREDDGIGRSVRNGLNFTERGFGIRGAVGNPDRGNTAASQIKPCDVDWDHILENSGCVGFTPVEFMLRFPKVRRKSRLKQ